MLFEGRCALCQKFNSIICPSCAARLTALPDIALLQGNYQIKLFPRTREVAELLLMMKKNNRTALRSWFASYLADFLYSDIFRNLKPNIGATAISLYFLPSNQNNHRKLGYDHLALFRKTLIKELKSKNLANRQRSLVPIFCHESILQLSPKALDQRGLNQSARQVNVRGAISLKSSKSSSALRTGGSLWLIDDVITTGATFLESIAVLRSEGIYASGGIFLAGNSNFADK
jgi:predicted amidophosphoribosyltransferase